MSTEQQPTWGDFIQMHLEERTGNYLRKIPKEKKRLAALATSLAKWMNKEVIFAVGYCGLCFEYKDEHNVCTAKCPLIIATGRNGSPVPSSWTQGISKQCRKIVNAWRPWDPNSLAEKVEKLAVRREVAEETFQILLELYNEELAKFEEEVVV